MVTKSFSTGQFCLPGESLSWWEYFCLSHSVENSPVTYGCYEQGHCQASSSTRTTSPNVKVLRQRSWAVDETLAVLYLFHQPIFGYTQSIVSVQVVVVCVLLALGPVSDRDYFYIFWYLEQNPGPCSCQVNCSTPELHPQPQVLHSFIIQLFIFLQLLIASFSIVLSAIHSATNHLSYLLQVIKSVS